LEASEDDSHPKLQKKPEVIDPTNSGCETVDDEEFDEIGSFRQEFTNSSSIHGKGC